MKPNIRGSTLPSLNGVTFIYTSKCWRLQRIADGTHSSKPSLAGPSLSQYVVHILKCDLSWNMNILYKDGKQALMDDIPSHALCWHVKWKTTIPLRGWHLQNGNGFLIWIQFPGSKWQPAQYSCWKIPWTEEAWWLVMGYMKKSHYWLHFMLMRWVAQSVKYLPAMQECGFWSTGWERSPGRWITLFCSMENPHGPWRRPGLHCMQSQSWRPTGSHVW